MPNSLIFKVVVLWDHELRAAAKALQAADAAKDEEWPVAAASALQACYTALQGITDDQAVTVMSATERLRLESLSPQTGPNE